MPHTPVPGQAPSIPDCVQDLGFQSCQLKTAIPKAGPESPPPLLPFCQSLQNAFRQAGSSSQNHHKQLIEAGHAEQPGLEGISLLSSRRRTA